MLITIPRFGVSLCRSEMLQKPWIIFSTMIGRVGVDSTDSESLRLKKRLLVAISIAIIPLALGWGSLYLISGEITAALIPWTYAAISSVSIVHFSMTGNFRFFRSSELLLILALPFALQIALGGFVQGSGVLMWSWLAPLGALLLADRKQALWWLVAFVGLLAIGGILEGKVLRINDLPAWLKTTFFVLNLGTVAAITFSALRYFNGQRDWAMNMLELEQQKSEQLLLNVLPPSIVTLLKGSQQTIARHHEEASIMFADIANFTPLSAALQPGEIVEMLNGVFTKFDQLTEGHGLEKIKTIGDSYMVAAGVPEARSDHAEVLAELALEMMSAVRSQTFNGHSIVLRIGLNSGPVVAGVIGKSKFSYDLWGDTVNTASRIQQYGVLGEIQIGNATRKRIEQSFVIEEREPMEMKGKGLMQVYLLKGRKHLPSSEKDLARI